MSPRRCEEDAPEWWGEPELTDEQIDAMAEEYAREQMATAQSEAAWEAMTKECEQ